MFWNGQRGLFPNRQNGGRGQIRSLGAQGAQTDDGRAGEMGMKLVFAVTALLALAACAPEQ